MHRIKLQQLRLRQKWCITIQTLALLEWKILQDVYVPYIGNDTDGEMTPFKDENGNIVYFDIPVWGFNYITGLGWELYWHDDNHNAIQNWIIKKKVTKQQFDKLTKDKIGTSNSLKRIPSAVEELQRMVK